MSKVAHLKQQINEIQAFCEHRWRIRDSFLPKLTAISSICFEEEFTLVCSKCERAKQTKTTDICPCCFSPMQKCYIDERKASKFQHHPDPEDDYDMPVVYECENEPCKFRAVRFVEDR